MPTERQTCARWRAGWGRCLVICDAAGGYEARLLAALLAAGVPAHRADAHKVKAFIRPFSTLGKSDAIDTWALAIYGAERHVGLPRWEQPDPAQAELQSLALAQADLVALRQAQVDRLSAPGADVVAASLRAVVREVSRQIRVIEARIDGVLRRHLLLPRAPSLLRGSAGSGRRRQRRCWL